VEKRSGEDNKVSEDKTDQEYREGVAKYCDVIERVLTAEAECMAAQIHSPDPEEGPTASA
jgi:hypothetical protein